MISQNSQQHKETVIIVMHRLAIPDSLPGSSYQKSKKTGTKLMCRMAAYACPPGGFWAEPRISRKQRQTERKIHTFTHGSTKLIDHNYKHTKQLP